jgi:Sec-independent protein translocase protein TatA
LSSSAAAGQVIAGIGALIFGPKNLAGLGKDLGKVAGSLKKEVAPLTKNPPPHHSPADPPR